MKKILISYFTFYILHFTFIFAEPGTTALNFLKIAPGVKGVGMGEAFTAIADDASGFYWNPAGLSQIEYQAVNAGYTSWFQNINYQTLTFIHPFRFGNLSLCLNNLSFGDIEGYTSTGAPTDDVTAYDRVLIVSYAKKVQKETSAGLNFKVVQEKLDDESILAYVFDLGLLYHFRERFSLPLQLGIAVQNIGSCVEYIAEKDDLPFNIKTGVGYKFLNDDITLAVDYNVPKDNTGYFNVGMEYQFLDLFRIRAGYKFRDIEGVRLGAGIGNGKVDFDYAFVPYGILGDTHRFGLNFYFGKSHNLDMVQSRIEKHLRKGKRYFSKTDLIDAQREFKSVLIYDPTNAEAESYLEKIKSRISEINIEKYMDAGKEYLKEDDLMKAKEAFDNILVLMPENTRARQWQDKTEARILEEQKRRLEVLFNHGLEFYKRGEYSSAIEVWQKVLLLDKNHSASKEYIVRAEKDIKTREKLKAKERLKVLYETAEELYEKGEYKKALDIFTEIARESEDYLQIKQYLIKTEEKVANVYFKEGQKLYENGFYKEALDVFKKSLKYSPKHKDASDYIPKCEDKLAQEKEQLRIAADEYNRKGLIEYNQGNIEKAIKFFEKALESDPEHKTAGRNLERAKREQK
ncbi:MAG: PorV/PorQ family protein [Elusimicrobia bacterium]|nr:PorV/PorQ family protein [Elusimicrobiota bacterium]